MTDSIAGLSGIGPALSRLGLGKTVGAEPKQNIGWTRTDEEGQQLG